MRIIDSMGSTMMNFIEKSLPVHHLPWKASLLPPLKFGVGVWGLTDSNGFPMLVSINEKRARQDENFINTEFAEEF